MSIPILPDDTPVVKDKTRTRSRGSVTSRASLASIAPGGGRADAYDIGLRQAHSDVAAMSVDQVATLLLALTTDVGALGPADLARLRLGAVKFAVELARLRGEVAA